MYASTRAQPPKQRSLSFSWWRCWDPLLPEFATVVYLSAPELKQWVRLYPNLYLSCSPFLSEVSHA